MKDFELNRNKIDPDPLWTTKRTDTDHIVRIENRTKMRMSTPLVYVSKYDSSKEWKSRKHVMEPSRTFLQVTKSQRVHQILIRFGYVLKHVTPKMLQIRSDCLWTTKKMDTAHISDNKNRNMRRKFSKSQKSFFLKSNPNDVGIQNIA